MGKPVQSLKIRIQTIVEDGFDIKLYVASYSRVMEITKEAKENPIGKQNPFILIGIEISLQSIMSTRFSANWTVIKSLRWRNNMNYGRLGISVSSFQPLWEKFDLRFSLISLCFGVYTGLNPRASKSGLCQYFRTGSVAKNLAILQNQ